MHFQMRKVLLSVLCFALVACSSEPFQLSSSLCYRIVDETESTFALLFDIGEQTLPVSLSAELGDLQWSCNAECYESDGVTYYGSCDLVDPLGEGGLVSVTLLRSDESVIETEVELPPLNREALPPLYEFSFGDNCITWSGGPVVYRLFDSEGKVLSSGSAEGSLEYPEEAVSLRGSLFKDGICRCFTLALP